MSYMALYRKWRPNEFEEVKGQEHIVTTLKNQIKHDRIGHAYLFCGTRGTGKTTVAKLLAKVVNCEHPVDGSPCNECASCKAIQNGISMNVIEIDAASNNGVDNIRQINEAVQYSPSQGKYLVYIIDEVHMLSTGAFNALLKTLEEPPAYVIFILATTEAHKIPITIMSRCQRYDFRRISIETIADRLEELLKREQVPATREALDYVARAADGSMRDALSILDRCIAFNLGQELTYDRVLNTIGAVDVDVYARITEAIAGDEMNQVMEIIDEVVWQGRDLTQFVNDFIWFVRNMLFIKMSPSVAGQLDLTSENVERITELGKQFSEEQLIRYLNLLQELAVSIKNSTIKRVTLEMGIIKMCRPEMEKNYDAIFARLDQLEKKTSALEARPAQVVAQTTGSIIGTDSETEALSPEERSAQIQKNVRERYPDADYEEIMKLASMWKTRILPELSSGCSRYLKNAKVVAGKGAGELQLVYANTSENAVAIEYFEKEENILYLERVISELIERSVKVVLLKPSGLEMKNAGYAGFDITKINGKIDFVD